MISSDSHSHYVTFTQINIITIKVMQAVSLAYIFPLPSIKTGLQMGFGTMGLSPSSKALAKA